MGMGRGDDQRMEEGPRDGAARGEVAPMSGAEAVEGRPVAEAEAGMGRRLAGGEAEEGLGEEEAEGAWSTGSGREEPAPRGQLPWPGEGEASSQEAVGVDPMVRVSPTRGFGLCWWER
ncbi:hypothetical protein ZWY2020_058541 [Hordeum vulgare]|nr:hypothetical protein ZWY2020_058541 [Hordeum vulgare]